MTSNIGRRGGRRARVPQAPPRVRDSAADLLVTAAADRAIARAVALHADAERWRDAGDPRRATACARRAVALFERHEGRAHPDVAAALLALGGARELGDAGARRCGATGARTRSWRATRGCAIRTCGGCASRRRARCAACCARWGGTRRPSAHGRRAVRAGRAIFRRARSGAGRRAQRPGHVAQVPGALRRGAAALPARAGDPARAPGWAQAPTPRASITTWAASSTRAPATRRASRTRGARSRCARARWARGHPSVAADVAALAAIVEGRGRLAEAERLYGRALAVFRRAFGARQLRGRREPGGAGGRLPGARARRAGGAAVSRGAGDPPAAVRRPPHRGRADAQQPRDRDRGDPARQSEALRIAKRALAAFRAAGGQRHPGTLLCAANVASWTA